MTAWRYTSALSIFFILSVQLVPSLMASGESSVNLKQLSYDRSTSLSVEEIKALNLAELDRLNSLPLEATHSSNRLTGLNEADIQKLMKSMDTHPIVGPEASPRYERGANAIGYCFGRATYLHLLMLAIGVDRSAIQKLWAVGPIYAMGEYFQFHVATAVRSTETGRWRVIDHNIGKVLDANEWYDFYQAESQDKKMSFYSTSPKHFIQSVDRYKASQMGLNLDASKDWYRGYFKDLMSWFNGSDGVALKDKVAVLGLDATTRGDSCKAVFAK